MISPWQQFDTQPPWKFPLNLDSKPLDVSALAPSNFQLILHPTNGGQEIVGAGYFSNLLTADSALPGSPPSIIYNVNRADVSILGEYRSWMLITYDDDSQETLFLGYLTIQGR